MTSQAANAIFAATYADVVVVVIIIVVIGNTYTFSPFSLRLHREKRTRLRQKCRYLSKINNDHVFPSKRMNIKFTGRLLKL